MREPQKPLSVAPTCYFFFELFFCLRLEAFLGFLPAGWACTDAYELSIAHVRHSEACCIMTHKLRHFAHLHLLSNAAFATQATLLHQEHSTHQRNILLTRRLDCVCHAFLLRLAFGSHDVIRCLTSCQLAVHFPAAS